MISLRYPFACQTIIVLTDYYLCTTLTFMVVVICTDFMLFVYYQCVIEAGLIGPLVNLLQTAEFDIKKEAAWALSNATSGGSNEQIKYVILLHPS